MMTKPETRAALLKARAAAHSREVEGPLDAMARWLKPHLPTGKTLGAYQPIKTERDPRPLLELMDAPLAFPKVMGAAQPLTFFAAGEPEDFELGAFNVLEPKSTLPTCVPDVILVPLVGFDLQGYRLGYGGGFYDRTLEKFRAQKPIFAIGFAYDGQVSDQPLNFEPTDLALDAIITPTVRYEFTSAGVMEAPWS